MEAYGFNEEKYPFKKQLLKSEAVFIYNQIFLYANPHKGSTRLHPFYLDPKSLAFLSA